MPKKKTIKRKRKGTPEEIEQRDRYTKLRSMLRRAWSKDPERYAVLNAGKRPYALGINKKQKWEYNCNMCNNWFKATDISVDHIIPAGTFKGPDDWATFGPGLFCVREHLQLLCKSCHDRKSNEERAGK